MAYVGKIFINLEESERENKSIKVAEVSILSMCSGEQFCVRSCVCVCFKVWLFIQDVAFCNFLYITFLSLRYNFVFFFNEYFPFKWLKSAKSRTDNMVSLLTRDYSSTQKLSTLCVSRKLLSRFLGWY